MVGGQPGPVRPRFDAETEGSFRVDIEAMRWEAEEWKKASENMYTASTIAGGLSLDASDFSFVAEDCGVVENYRELQEWITRLAMEAGVNLLAMTNALHEVIYNYSTQDSDSAHAIHKAAELGGGS